MKQLSHVAKKPTTRTAILFFSLLLRVGYSQSEKIPSSTPIDTSLLVNINGVEQYLEMKSTSLANPVLLFIHGGPSWPATPMLRKYNSELTKDFILVSWDQRNCGKSKTDNTIKLTTDLYVEDAHQVTQLLKAQFKTKKIMVVGNSWGSIIGIQLITKYPDDYSTYIGVGQVVSQGRGMMLARDYVVKQASIKNDTTVAKSLGSIITSDESIYTKSFEEIMKFFQLATPYLHSEQVAALEDITQLYPDYHYSKMDWITPLMTSGKELFNYMNSVRLDISKFKEFKMPVYFFAGRFDYNTPSTLVEEYYNQIRAPKKALFWFERSGHSPHWEEPGLFHQRVRQIAVENKLK